MMYSKGDSSRKLGLDNHDSEYRTEFRRDYARLVHSPSFRRLNGKTQLYPGKESDFFRNRLTHSLEVAQLAKSITLRINNILRDSGKDRYIIDTDLVEFAGLAHDLGHPPFGHIGEKALDELMMKYGGFEGNAQTFRILSVLEKKHKTTDHISCITDTGLDSRVGLNLTYRSLASVLKYDKQIPVTPSKKRKHPQKGYYACDKELINKLKTAITKGKPYPKPFKTIECQIMDVADDIAYSTYDLEDAFKGGFITPFDIIHADTQLLQRITNKIKKLFPDITVVEVREEYYKIFKALYKKLPFDKYSDTRELAKLKERFAYQTSNYVANNGYYRTETTSILVAEFIRGVNVKINSKIPALSKIVMDNEVRFRIELLKTFAYESQIESSMIALTENRGKEIIRKIFSSLISDRGHKLLPLDVQQVYERMRTKKNKMRVISDFIASMTDNYAIEFYGRLVSERPETIFKPI